MEKTKISANVIAHSIYEQSEIVTFELIFPRFILAELNTHRAFSRNSASSRAIPFNKMVESIQTDPFIPIAWQKDHKGMQGTEYLTDGLSIHFAKSNWLTARDWAIKSAKSLNSTDNGYEAITKQLCNRLLEPFMWHKVILTGTDFINFFELRCPDYQLEERDDHDNLIKLHHFKSKKEVLDQGNWYSSERNEFTDKFKTLDWLSINKGQSEIHMMALAEAMYTALCNSEPVKTQFHIPYENQIKENYPEISFEELLKVSVTSCARTSYTTIASEKKFNLEKDIEMYEKLKKANHASPFEHVAYSAPDPDSYYYNLYGWRSIRYLIDNKLF